MADTGSKKLDEAIDEKFRALCARAPLTEISAAPGIQLQDDHTDQLLARTGDLEANAETLMGTFALAGVLVTNGEALYLVPQLSYDDFAGSIVEDDVHAPLPFDVGDDFRRLVDDMPPEQLRSALVREAQLRGGWEMRAAAVAATKGSPAGVQAIYARVLARLELETRRMMNPPDGFDGMEMSDCARVADLTQSLKDLRAVIQADGGAGANADTAIIKKAAELLRRIGLALSQIRTAQMRTVEHGGDGLDVPGAIVDVQLFPDGFEDLSAETVSTVAGQLIAVLPEAAAS